MKLKSLNRSVWTPIFYGISGILMLFYLSLTGFFSKGFLSDWEKILTYPNVAIGILTVGMSVFWTQQEPEFEKTLYSPVEMHGRRFLALFWFVFRFFLIANALTFVLNLVRGVRWDFAFRYLFQLTVDTALAITLQILAGILLGILVPNSYAYLGTVPCSLLFSPILSGFISVPIGISLLNPFVKDVSVPTTPQFYPWTDTTFSYEKFFSIQLIFLLGFLLLFFSCGERRRKMIISPYIFFLLFMMYRFTRIYGISLPSEKYLRTNGKEACASFAESKQFVVEEIRMNPMMGEFFRNDVFLTVRKKEPQAKQFSFLLEETLSSGIHSLTINEENASFETDGQRVSVRLPQEIDVGSTFLLHIIYEGEIKYLLNPGALFYMVNENHLNLPPSLPWYPFTGEDTAKKYVIDLEQKDVLLTNLNEYRLLPAGKHHLEGNAAFLFLSVGDYVRQKIGDKEVVAAREFFIKDNQINDFFEFARWWEQDTHHHPDTYILIPHIHGFIFPDGKNTIFSQLF